MKNFPLAKVLFTFCFFSFQLISLQADNTVDSLYQLVERAPNDSLKMMKYESLLIYLGQTNNPLFEEYTLACLDYAKKRNIPEGIGMGYMFLGNVAYDKGNYEESIENYQKAKDYSELVGNPAQLIMSLYNIGFSYGILGDLEKEKECALEAFEIADTLGMNYYKGLTTGMLSSISNREGNIEKAIEYIDASIVFFHEDGNYYSYAISMLDKGKLLKAESLNDAKNFLNQVLEISVENKFTILEISVLTELCQIFQQLGEIKNSLETAYQILSKSKELNDVNKIIFAYLELGNLHKLFTNREKAIEYYTKCITLADSSNHVLGKTLCTSQIGLTHLDNGSFKTAIEFLDKALLMSSKNDLPSTIYYDLGQAYISTNNLQKAYSSLLKGDSMVISESSNVLFKKYVNWGEYYLAVGQLRKARNACNQGLTISYKNQNVEFEKEASELLYKISNEDGNYFEALRSLERFKILEDSINEEKHIRRLTTIELTNQFDQEKETLALQQSKQEALLKAETKQSQTVAFGIGILALLGFGFFWNARRNNKKIATQNEKITNQNSQLQQLNLTKDRIFAIIGHDLRKPAINFRGVAKKVNYLLENQDFETLNLLGNEIEKDALALNKLTDNLLNWALTQKDVMPYNPVSLPLREISEEIVTLFHHLAADKSLKIINNISPDLEVFADLNALQSIIRNLIDNAVKYSNIGGKIDLAAISTTEGVKIEISDNGVGIPNEKLKDLFLLQNNKSQQGTKGEKGTGLGLHLVQELVKLNQGLISVKSQLGLGTNIEVILPIMA